MRRVTARNGAVAVTITFEGMTLSAKSTFTSWVMQKPAKSSPLFSCPVAAAVVAIVVLSIAAHCKAPTCRASTRIQLGHGIILHLGIESFDRLQDKDSGRMQA